jgi:hypothetical protein
MGGYVITETIALFQCFFKYVIIMKKIKHLEVIVLDLKRHLRVSEAQVQLLHFPEQVSSFLIF